MVLKHMNSGVCAITFHSRPCQTMVTSDAYSLRNKISDMFDASFPTRHMHMI